MDERAALDSLAQALGVHTHYTDGLGRPVTVHPETLLRVCRALGAQLDGPEDAAGALEALTARRALRLVPPVLVAWDGNLPPWTVPGDGPLQAELLLESGAPAPLEVSGRLIHAPHPLPVGYHVLTVESGGRRDVCTVISAPVQAYRRPGPDRSWGIGTHLAALRSRRSRSLGDLKDLETVCRWVGRNGGDLVTALPLLPTFNRPPAEPSPYSPVSRLYWSELILELGEHHAPVPAPASLDVTAADDEVRAALAGAPEPDPSLLDDQLLRYARFRGAQAKLGRNWRDWPEAARRGELSDEDVDAAEERFHRVAQGMVREQLGDLRRRMDDAGVRLGLDLAVGVHPDGFDPWAGQPLFAQGMSVGAPPDPGFPSGQDWGFSPVLPHMSREEGHRYLAASIGHQASLSGVLRVDHIMAWTRLYWIPHGMGLHEGTYVNYPAEELFAVLVLESNRHRCEVVGENLGTVPPDIDEALPRHRIWGMYLAEFQANAPDITPPAERDMALIGTHDTPTFAGWIEGVDIQERVRCNLLDADAAPGEEEGRTRAAHRLAEKLQRDPGEKGPFLDALLEWLGASESPLVVPWLEDLWLEVEQVNLPGTRSSARPNWQRPMKKLLDEIFEDPEVAARIRILEEARRR